MKTIELHAKSSSREEPYSVVFRLKGNLLSIECDCPAGIRGQLCKHRLSFVCNKATMLYDSEQVRQLEKVCKWVNCSGYNELLAELGEAEKELEEAKKKLKANKYKLGRLMIQGIDCSYK